MKIRLAKQNNMYRVYTKEVDDEWKQVFSAPLIGDFDFSLSNEDDVIKIDENIPIELITKEEMMLS